MILYMWNDNFSSYINEEDIKNLLKDSQECKKLMDDKIYKIVESSF